MANTILILDNIRSTHNVGSIMRTADGFGVTAIYFCGYTPYPAHSNDPRLPHEQAKITQAIHKTALGAETTIKSEIFPDASSAITKLKAMGYLVAGLEQSETSTPVVNFKPHQDIAILLGNEVTGIEPATLSRCDVVLEIPMFGKKESFNVSIAAAICLYELNRE